MDLVGERWGLLVVRELLLGPKRFTDLRAGLPNASPNVLSERLRELERGAIVRRRKLPPPAGSSVYELTDWGRELGPIVLALGGWAVRSPSFPEDAPVGVDSAILGMTSLFDPDAAEGFDATLELGLDDDRFRVRVADGKIEIDREPVEDPDAVIETTVETLHEVIWQRLEVAKAVRDGEIRIEGDRRAASRFVGLFPLPEQAAPPALAPSG
jgi:DNA-binding HxlR family transcriptional regulator/putative sterol carrier protein